MNSARRLVSFPEPGASLLRRTFARLAPRFDALTPCGRKWAIGGGTVLASRWGHRASTDIDVCLPKDSGVAALWPSWNAEFVTEVQSLGATEIREKAQGLTVAFEGGGVVDVTEVDYSFLEDLEDAIVDGMRVSLLTTHSILFGKLHGRGLLIPVRDAFDIAVARHEDPAALRRAVNRNDRALLTEMLHELELSANRPGEPWDSPLFGLSAEWAHIADGVALKARDAVESVMFTAVSLVPGDGEVSLELECGDGWRYEETFGSLKALAQALRRHGLNPALAVANESVAHAFGKPGGEP